MEQIALISDIHANIYALEAVMKFIDGECSVSRVLNMGDFIQIGPNPREVFDVVMNDERFVSIMGNSEYMFFDDAFRSRYQKEKEHQEWVERELGEFLADYVADADYVLIGHTHLPLYAVHWAGKPVVNPGAVGCGKDGMARFAIAGVEDGQVSLSFHQVKYDKAKVLAAYGRQAVPCAERFAAMFF